MASSTCKNCGSNSFQLVFNKDCKVKKWTEFSLGPRPIFAVFLARFVPSFFKVSVKKLHTQAKIHDVQM